MCCSEDAFLVVLKLHDERLDVLALSLPVLDALLSVAVEVLLLLVEKSLRLEGISLLLLEVTDSVPVLDVSLVLLEVSKLSSSETLFFLLLLLSELKLLVSDSPEGSEVSILLLLSSSLGLLSLDLELTASLNSGFHLSLALLLLLIETIGTILCFSNLTVQDFLLVVLQGTELLDLSVNHALPS